MPKAEGTSHSSDVSGEGGEGCPYECVCVGTDDLLHHPHVVQVIHVAALVSSIVPEETHSEFSGGQKWSEEAWMQKYIICINTKKASYVIEVVLLLSDSSVAM